MNLLFNIIIITTILILGLLFLKYVQKIFNADKYQKIMSYIPLIKVVYLFIIANYFILVHLFDSIILGLFTTTLIFILIKKNLENIYYSCIFNIKEAEFINYTFIFKEKQGTIKSIDLTNLILQNNDIIYSIPYSELFKYGYQKTKKLNKENVYSLSFIIKDGFKLNDFEKYLFTLNCINFKHKPSISINNNKLEIIFNRNNIENKNDIYKQILNHRYIDEL